jgi:Tol biopolymer transport system component/predicted Ser/Thr protein kinase
MAPTIMLAPGVRFGPYEIVSILGAGGMGHVYRARDTRLQRAVALKLLPEEFRERPERQQRFKAEARLISALSHPHICALFDVGEQDGAAFLVMEYLEGETLEDRLTNGPLTASEVLRYAAQIADALDHAHQAQITHRDLKPSNVMLTGAGVKLLDFGLARGPSLETSSASTQSLSSPARLTAEGTLVGTFQYMAPEQLEGKEADRRSDIFAFGAVLFEMATGRKAFAGSSQASLIASILTSRPPLISATRSATHADPLPRALDHVVDRCLAKNPDERWQTARDLKLELEWAATEGTHPTASRAISARRGYLRPILLVAAFAAVAAAAVFALARFRQPPAETIRFNVALPPGTALPRGVTGTRMALSPDGRRLAFVTTSGGVDRLWVQSLDSFIAQPLAEAVESPFWSPDSQTIGFFAQGEGALKKVAISGGPATVICPAAVDDVATWHANGTILFAQTDRGIFRVSADGGTPAQLTRIDSARKEINHLWPVWLPDGRHFLYTATSIGESGGRAPRAVYIRSIDSDEQDLLTHVESRILYSPPGLLLYVDQGALMSRALDVGARKLVGEPVKVADDVMYSRTNGNGAFSASQTGVLAFYGSVARSDLSSFDRSGRATKLSWADQPFASAIRISPDGQRVIADVQDTRTGSSDIWIYDLERKVPMRFTTDQGNDTSPMWSADGRQVVFSSDRHGAPDLFLKTTDGLDNEQAILAKPGNQLANDWSRDGTFIVFEENSRDTGLDLWKLSLEGDRTVRPLVHTRFQEWGARVSPDSAWIAFAANDSGAAEVYVAPVGVSGDKVRVSTGGGIAPRWRRDGRELFYVVPSTNSIMSVQVATKPTFKAGSPVRLFSTGLPASRRQTREVPYDVTPDGQQFLINTPPAQPPPSGITVVVNWTTGLSR